MNLLSTDYQLKRNKNQFLKTSFIRVIVLSIGVEFTKQLFDDVSDVEKIMKSNAKA